MRCAEIAKSFPHWKITEAMESDVCGEHSDHNALNSRFPLLYICIFLKDTAMLYFSHRHSFVYLYFS
jgi:hypothetical protein